MKRSTRIQQSAVRVQSGGRLVAFLLVICAFSIFLNILLLAKISGVLALFFTAVTALEYWNVWRLKNRPPEDHNRK